MIENDALQIRENHLRYCTYEAELDDNLVNAAYLRNLIAIERQINMDKLYESIHPIKIKEI